MFRFVRNVSTMERCLLGIVARSRCCPDAAEVLEEKYATCELKDEQEKQTHYRVDFKTRKYNKTNKQTNNNNKNSCDFRKWAKVSEPIMNV